MPDVGYTIAPWLGSRRDVTKRFGGGVVAVDDVELEIADGEFWCSSAPQAAASRPCCASSLASKRRQKAVSIGDRDVTDLAPRLRDVAMVFQTYALYPHMTVRRTSAYGLRYAERRRTTRAGVEEVADLLGLNELLDRRTALSGGQRQRRDGTGDRP